MMTCFHFSDAGRVSILVPGAGLGRLAFELAQRGYTCQGNEFSMFMLLASNFILNQYVVKWCIMITGDPCACQRVRGNFTCLLINTGKLRWLNL